MCKTTELILKLMNISKSYGETGGMYLKIGLDSNNFIC